MSRTHDVQLQTLCSSLQAAAASADKNHVGHVGPVGPVVYTKQEVKEEPAELTVTGGYASGIQCALFRHEAEEVFFFSSRP